MLSLQLLQVVSQMRDLPSIGVTEHVFEDCFDDTNYVLVCKGLLNALDELENIVIVGG